MPYGLGTATAWKHKEASMEVEKCKDKRENQQASKQTGLETCVFFLGFAFPDVNHRISVRCVS